jgi:cytoskeletal protein CcmA (bactofilin family)
MALIVLATLSVWAISICSISGTNLQLADNQRRADCVRAAAESGQEIVRTWLSCVAIAGDTPPESRFTSIASQFISAAHAVSGITPVLSGSVLTVPTVTLDSSDARSFSASLTQIDDETIRADVTGIYGSITKTIRANYMFGVRTDTVFDFGVATKGPLHLSGNIELEGVNVSVESDVFIESAAQNLALSIIGNSQIAGDVKITNPNGYVDLQGGQASIGGETGDAALNHVTIGHEPPEFPVPDPDHFAPYVTNIIDSSTDMAADATYENVRILAGTNPIFTGNVTLNGILFIETPNMVTFAGNVSVTGIIIGDGDVTDNSGANQVNFLGGVDSAPVTELVGSQFDGLQQEKNTFLLAPGFHLGFGGNFSTLNGAICGNGLDFFGNAGGTINGSVINYSDKEMTLSGNNDLSFNRSGTTEIPAGFIQDIVLNYDPQSYSEVPL